MSFPLTNSELKDIMRVGLNHERIFFELLSLQVDEARERTLNNLPFYPFWQIDDRAIEFMENRGWKLKGKG